MPNFFLFLLCLFQLAWTQLTLTGRVIDAQTNEPLIGAQVYVNPSGKGAVTDANGKFTLNLAAGAYNLTLSYLGYQEKKQTISLQTAMDLSISLSPVEIAEVKIEGAAVSQVATAEIGKITLQVKELETLPVIFGEKDIIKTIQLLPGVSGQEGSGGFFVRGGNPDQNLVLLDGIPVFNTSHQNGLVSVFASDALENVNIYKAGLPVQYGGRLSSVTLVESKKPALDGLHGDFGLGLLSSYFTLQGPLGKAGTTDNGWLLSGRISYFGIFPALILKFPIKLYFADLLGKFSFQLSPKDKLDFFFYTGGDNIGVNGLIDLYFYNGLSGLNWTHLFSDRLSTKTTLGLSNYSSWYYIDVAENVNFGVYSGITDYLMRQEVFYQINSQFFFTAGLDATFRRVRPGTLTPRSKEDATIPYYKVPEKNAIEAGIFSNLEYKIRPWLLTSFGFRYSFYTRIGTDRSFDFDKQGDIIDTNFYAKGKAFGFDAQFEPRVLFNFIVHPNHSIKVSYEREAQYLQLIQANPIGTPTDYWFPSGGTIQTQTSQQYALSFFNDFLNKRLEFNVEFYYKDLRNQIDYKDGATTLLNEAIEGKMAFGRGYSYGVEVLLKKKTGKWNGWIGYTWGNAYRRFDAINEGKLYPALQNRTHDLSLVLSYTPAPRHTISGVFVYYTGTPATLPVGVYEYEGNSVLQMSSRNAFTLPDYHRMDIAYTYRWKDFKKTPRLKASTVFSVYNIYYQKNPYTVTYKRDPDDPTKIELIQQSLYTILPAISLNFSF